MKKVLIVASSLRHSANSAILADEFARGATEAGHSVAMISLAGKSINFCKGCLACQQTQACVIQDSMAEILEQLRTADVIVFATPIYFYELSGQLKTLLDRTNPLFPAEYRFRDIYSWRPRRIRTRLRWIGPWRGWAAGSPALQRPGWLVSCGERA